jgi:hypothetical protein
MEGISHENWPSSYIMKFFLKEPRYNILFNLRWALGPKSNIKQRLPEVK